MAVSERDGMLKKETKSVPDKKPKPENKPNVEQLYPNPPPRHVPPVKPIEPARGKPIREQACKPPSRISNTKEMPCCGYVQSIGSSSRKPKEIVMRPQDVNNTNITIPDNGM